MKQLLTGILSLALVFSLAACSGGGGSATPAPNGGGSGNEAASTELNIYMWQQYISDQLISDFEAANNCKVNLSYMSDNADAITRLTAGGGQEYDLIMTCDALALHLWILKACRKQGFRRPIIVMGQTTRFSSMENCASNCL